MQKTGQKAIPETLSYKGCVNVNTKLIEYRQIPCSPLVVIGGPIPGIVVVSPSRT